MARDGSETSPDSPPAILLSCSHHDRQADEDWIFRNQASVWGKEVAGLTWRKAQGCERAPTIVIDHPSRVCGKIYGEQARSGGPRTESNAKSLVSPLKAGPTK